MKLYFIRHGETDWNEQGKLQGRADIPLNERGILLAELTAEGLKDVKFDLIITSPLNRAVETARIVTGDADIPVIMEPRIQEISWGDWEGLCCLKENFEIPGEEFHKFYSDPFGFTGGAGGETIREVCERAGEFYHELLCNEDYQDKTILISTHGCAVKAILHHIYEDKADFWHGGVPHNCAVNIVEVKEGQSVFLEEDKIYYDSAYMIERYRPVKE